MERVSIALGLRNDAACHSEWEGVSKHNFDLSWSIDKLFENQIKFLSGEHNVDIFFHTWNGSHITDAEDNVYYKNQVKFVKENIKPKKFFIEDSKKFEKNFINSPMCSDECFNKNYNPQKHLSNAVKPSNCLSMLYSIQQVNSLKKQYEQSNNIFMSDTTARVSCWGWVGACVSAI